MSSPKDDIFIYMAIHFFKEDITYNLKSRRDIKRWIASIITQKGKTLGDINIVLCSDTYLLKINKEYLKHDYYTDIITFDNVLEDVISGELFISIDRVMENGANEGIAFTDELHRVIIHGILHLLGYKDKTEMDASEMRRMEEQALLKRPISLSSNVPRGTSL